MKNLVILFTASVVLLFAACKKKDSASPTITTPTNPYYFKLTMDGTFHNFAADFPQYMPFEANEAGGYQSVENFFPSVGIRLRWPIDDTVKESDVLGLAGKTLYFSDTLIHPELSYTEADPSNEWLSIDTANTNFNIKINTVTYLKKDTTLGYYVSTYVISGTCNGIMYKGDSTAALTGGEFNFVISRRDL